MYIAYVYLYSYISEFFIYPVNENWTEIHYLLLCFFNKIICQLSWSYSLLDIHALTYEDMNKITDVRTCVDTDIANYAYYILLLYIFFFLF